MTVRFINELLRIQGFGMPHLTPRLVDLIAGTMNRVVSKVPAGEVDGILEPLFWAVSELRTVKMEPVEVFRAAGWIAENARGKNIKRGFELLDVIVAVWKPGKEKPLGAVYELLAFNDLSR